MNLRSLFRAAVWLCALAFALQMLFALVGPPPFVGKWLKAKEAMLDGEPQYVVVLGGGGIPSESGLMRTYYAAEYGVGRTGLTFIVSLPADGDPDTSSVGRMRDELIMRGIPPDSIQMEFEAVNTHGQAVAIGRMLGDAKEAPLLLVTSPEHVRRSLMCFKKEGFTQVGAYATMPVGAEADIGPGAPYRYIFWGRLEAHIRMARELCAIAYYKIRGWV